MSSKRVRRSMSLAAILAASTIVALAPVPAVADTDPNELVHFDGAMNPIDLELGMPGVAGRSADTSPEVHGSGDLEDLSGGELGVMVPDIYAEEPAAPTSGNPGMVSPQAVIGNDDRVYVQNPASVFPYSAISFVGTVQDGQGYLCSGYMIGSRAMGTAGHCFYRDGEYVDSITVYFGLDGTTAVAACSPTAISMPSGWTTTENPSFDWAMVQLNCNAGDVFGSFGFTQSAVAFPANYPTGNYYIAGYPSDKGSGGGYTMWMHGGQIYPDIANSARIQYQIDTFGGQSGAPVYRYAAGCGQCVYGTHAYGGASYNSGSSITASKYQLMVVYRDNLVGGA